jgi:cation diffusion facilitator CzcD-associated flavoprotein CzcO
MATDYLVVGAGASGLAFTDALVAETDADVTVIDRRHATGGRWLDAYPFVRLHTPSAYYRVNSLPLGADGVDDAGENAGFMSGRPARKCASTSPRPPRVCS